MRLDLFTVPWLGTILIVVGGVLLLVVVVSLIISVKKTRAQLRGEAPLPKPVDKEVDDYKNVDSPQKNGKKRFLDRIAPLIFEKGKDGKWKMSLGRTSYWFTMPVFIAMCVLAMVSLDNVAELGQPLVNLYLGVLGMLFLTNLGLLGYNLGNKFTGPMTMFLSAWGGSLGKGGDASGAVSAMEGITDLLGKDKKKNKEAAAVNEVADKDLNVLDKEPVSEEEIPAETPPQVGGPPPE